MNITHDNDFNPYTLINIKNRNGMKLSENLTLAECCKSATAIKNGIDNTPHGDHVDNLFNTAQQIFQPIRDHFGVPIKVTSGYRSEALNAKIGGSKTSQHSKGEALDLDADVFGGITNQEIFEFVRDYLDFDQLIHEFGDESNPDWVHISYSSKGNRKQVLRAYKVGGQTKYKSWM
jgi:zinc D-Ala-D-Ala carboxypeptidase